MTDRPSPEQQLAEVIELNRSRLLAGTAMQVSSPKIAAAIVAAVNSGEIDPIVPEGKVVVSGLAAVLIQSDDMAFIAASELAALRASVTSLAVEAQRMSTHYEAELAELRALKAKVDGLHATVTRNWMDVPPEWWSADCVKMLAWLREPTDD